MLTLRAPVQLVTTETECWKCKTLTLVSSLRVSELLEDGEVVADDARVVDAKFLPDAITHSVRRENPNYRIGHSRTAGMGYWANHCMHCGALQGDFFLNSEPDGPFFGGQVPEGSKTVSLFETGEWSADAGYCY